MIRVGIVGRRLDAARTLSTRDEVETLRTEQSIMLVSTEGLRYMIAYTLS